MIKKLIGIIVAVAVIVIVVIAAIRRDNFQSMLLRDEIENQRDQITHPDGRRAHFIDSTDEIRVELLTGLLDHANAALTRTTGEG